jgi:hypothetical protein
MDIIMKCYANYFLEYQSVLKKSKKKEDIALYERFGNHNNEFAEKIMQIYYARCKLLHRAAWFQHFGHKE